MGVCKFCKDVPVPVAPDPLDEGSGVSRGCWKTRHAVDRFCDGGVEQHPQPCVGTLQAQERLGSERHQRPLPFIIIPGASS